MGYYVRVLGIRDDSIGVDQLRSAVLGEVPGAEFEIEEFLDELEDARPEAAARWLADYLPRVKVIYAFQILSSIDHGSGWAILDAVRKAVWSVCGGILQADAEGFTNEAGYQITWQFSDNVSSRWPMAVLNSDGSWSAFEMELGDPAQREAFLQGCVPEGASPA